MKLTQVATASLAGDAFDVARNGDHFHLVQDAGPDAYGRPVARQVDLKVFALTMKGELDLDRIQALLDAYGEALCSLRAQKDMNLKRGPG